MKNYMHIYDLPAFNTCKICVYDKQLYSRVLTLLFSNGITVHRKLMKLYYLFIVQHTPTSMFATQLAEIKDIRLTGVYIQT